MAGFDRRKFLKRTGGAVASTAIPNVDTLNKVVGGLSGAASPGFRLSPAFLLKYISKVGDIPYDNYTYEDGQRYSLDVLDLLKFMGIDYNSIRDGKNDPEDTFAKVLASTGDREFVAQLRREYDRIVSSGEPKSGAMYHVIWKGFRRPVSEEEAMGALGKLIAVKGHSALDVFKHASRLGSNSSEILKGIIKSRGGPREFFKMDTRKLKDIYAHLPDVFKKYNHIVSLQDLEKYLTNTTLQSVVKFPNVNELLDLPDWLVQAVKKAHIEYPEDPRGGLKDVEDYMSDLIKSDRQTADKKLGSRYKPRTTSLGHWDKEGKKLGVLGPGGSYGRLNSENVHCYTNNYKLLVEGL